mgnify:CR=1 FL=1
MFCESVKLKESTYYLITIESINGNTLFTNIYDVTTSEILSMFLHF